MIRLALLSALMVTLATADPSSLNCTLPKCKILAGLEIHCDPNAWYEYHPHPTYRTLFVQCSPSEPKVMFCAPGTAWSQSAGVCVHDVSAPSCTADIHNVCDCDNCYLADPSDSASYYSCKLDANGNRGAPLKVTCPSGTTFSSITSTCGF